MVSNDELRQVGHMQNDAITRPNAALDQSAAEAFNFGC
jgi:hypothetical protein